jgi:4-hydroxy-tetrahydrodipicolinate synthase
MAGVCGVNVAAITPRRAGSEMDLAAVFELLDFFGRSGVNGVSLMGATGEFVHFDLEERARLITLAVKRSRVPVIPGVGHSTLDGAVLLAREAAAAGAVGVLLMPPYFYRYSQEEVREFYLCFARELQGAAPVFLYNIPAFTNEIACDTALELLATGLFAGIKDSGGKWEDFERLKAARDGGARRFTLLAGDDALYRRARDAGADGVVSGAACAVPELMVALDRSIMAGRGEAADRMEGRLEELLGWLRRFPTPAGIREALRLRGLRTGPGAAPLGEAGKAQMAEFREWFQGWLPAVLREAAGA